MLVRLTFVKRFTCDGFLYRSERVYRVAESYATQLLQHTVNDMPVFRIILEDQLKESDTVVELMEEDAEEVAPTPKPKAKVVKPKVTKKQKVVKKAPAKLRKIVSTEPEEEDNVEMV